MHNPIRVAKEQCGTVGLNSTRTTLESLVAELLTYKITNMSLSNCIDIVSYQNN